MRILIADGDDGVRSMVRTLVEDLGHDVVEARDGDEAWAVFSRLQPEIVVLDRLLRPGPNGLELCRAIRSSEEDTLNYASIVLLTSLRSRQDVLDCLEAGADDYVAKPLDPFVLHARLLVARRVTMVHHEMRRYRAELAQQAATDPLTGLNNRLRLAEELDRQHAISTRYGRAYSLALCDIDHFKLFNDTYGHQAGDDALRQIAAALAGSGRRGEGVYRYGGEEFLLVLPEQGAEPALLALERLRGVVEALAIPNPGTEPGVLTMSVGIASYVPGSDYTAEQLVGDADAALYRAKAEGRNRVEVATPAAGPQEA
jgi:two-component system chemotaxis response regulator CheY